MTGAAYPGPRHEAADAASYVTARIDDQLFGIAIEQVHDVFNLGSLTPVPLAPRSILGLLNLRGRVVTAIDLRHRLGIPGVGRPDGRMAIGMEADRQAYCLVVDAVGEIVKVEAGAIEPNPIHLHPGWSALSRGVHRLGDTLLVALDVASVLDFSASPPSHRLS